MRVWQERATAGRLARAAAGARRRPAGPSPLLSVARSAGQSGAGALAVLPSLELKLQRHLGLQQQRALSFRSKFPTADEAAGFAAKDELEEDKASPKLVCGKCNSPLSRTRDLVFIKWKSGIHLSSTSDAPLERMRSEETWDGEDATWKKHKLHCLKCNHQVGTLARVYASEKILFSATRVSIQMPENKSPLMSFSGYPSSLLGFSMWSELILMAEAQPSLKEALQISRVDKIRDSNHDRKQMNRKLLMAKDLRDLLRIVDENSIELNDVNIRTAIDRAARFVSSRSTRANLVSVNHNMSSLTPSEAPEDQLLMTTLPTQALPFPGTFDADATDRKRFFKLIDLTENLVTFGVASFKRGYDLSFITNALVRLGVGRESILRPIAQQFMFMVNSDSREVFANDASLIATAIVHLLPKDQRREPWVLEVLQAAKDIVVAESTNAQSPMSASLEILVPLARTYAAVDDFDPTLFSLLFDAVASGALDREELSQKRKSLILKIYQIHLDCILQKRGPEFRLPKHLEAEFHELFTDRQINGKSTSFRLHHLVASALDHMGVAHTASFTVPEGYSMDLAMPKHHIGIEVNMSTCYQAAQNEFGVDDERPFAYVDLKARHLEQLGWIVIQLHAERFQAMATLDERASYLSMLMEVAMQRRRESAAISGATVSRK